MNYISNYIKRIIFRFYNSRLCQHITITQIGYIKIKLTLRISHPNAIYYQISTTITNITMYYSITF